MSPARRVKGPAPPTLQTRGSTANKPSRPGRPKKKQTKASAASREVTGKATYRNSRRQVESGTLSSILTDLAAMPASSMSANLSAETLNAWRAQVASQVEAAATDAGHDSSVAAASGTTVVTPVVESDTPIRRIPDREVHAALDAIRLSEVAVFLDRLLDEAKAKPGRTARVPVEALLVAMWLAARNNHAMHLSEFATILFHGISPAARRLLGVTDGVTRRPTSAHPRHRWNLSAARAVGATFKKMCDLIDPADEVMTRRKIRWADMPRRGLTDDQIAELRAKLDWVGNQILLVSYNGLEPGNRAADDGSRCVDGTVMPVFANGRERDDEMASADAQAAWHIRERDHSDPREDPAVLAGVKKPKKGTYTWAYEAHLLVAMDTHPTEIRVPALVTSLTVDRPSFDVSGNARRLLAAERSRGFTPGYLAGDGAYGNALAEKFQSPARAAGYRLVLPLLNGSSGHQETHESGMLLVDGQYYCPAMPDHIKADLVSAYRRKEIDFDTYAARMKARNQYLMMTKQNANLDGVGERLGCRAADHSKSVICPLKAGSVPTEALRDNPDADGAIAGDPRDVIDLDALGRLDDPRPLINTTTLPLIDNEPSTCCSKQYVTLKPTDGAKYRQSLPGGSEEQTTIYNTLRQSQEGMHGFVKNDHTTQFGVGGRRRVRRRVAQHLFAAFLLAAANLNKIASFAAQARRGADGVLYRLRKPHKRERLPPGPPGAANPAVAASIRKARKMTRAADPPPPPDAVEASGPASRQTPTTPATGPRIR